MNKPPCWEVADMVFCSAMAILIFATVLSVKTSDILSRDFMDFYWAGSMVAHGHGSELYNAALSPVPQPYCHLPFEAIMFVPLSLLPLRTAFRCWGLVQILAMGLSLCLLWKYIPANAISRLALYSAIIFPFGGSLLIGQDGATFLLLLVLAFRAMKSGNEPLAGAWLGLALFRFQLLIPLLAIILLKRRWRVLGGLVAMGILLAGMSFAIVGSALPSKYMGILLHMAKADNARWMPTVKGLTAIMGIPPYAAIILSGCLACAVMIMWLPIGWSPSASEFEVMFALTIIVGVMTSWHSFLYDYTVLFLPFCLLLRNCKAIAAAIAAYFPMLLILPYSQNRGLFAIPALLAVIGGLYYMTRMEKSARKDRIFMGAMS